MSDEIDSEIVVPVPVYYDGDIRYDLSHNLLKTWKFKKKSKPDTYITYAAEDWTVRRITHPIFITKILANGVQQIDLLGFYVDFVEVTEALYVPLEYMFELHLQITLEYLYTCNIPYASWKETFYEILGDFPPVRDSVNISLVKLNPAMATDRSNTLIVKEEI